MLRVEEPRDVEIRADVLNDDIGRVAPAADGDVTVGQCETGERDLVGAFHHRHARARRVGQVRGVDRIHASQIRAKRGGDAVLSGGRAVAELGSQRPALILVNPERRRAFRRELQQVFGDFLEQSGHECLFLNGIGGGAGFARAAWQKGNSGAGREGGERLPARDFGCEHAVHGSGFRVQSVAFRFRVHRSSSTLSWRSRPEAG